MATWAKLRNGEWGVRVKSWGCGVTESDRLIVTNSKGESKEVEVRKVLWEGRDGNDPSVRILLCSVRPVQHRNDWQYEDETL